MLKKEIFKRFPAYNDCCEKQGGRSDYSGWKMGGKIHGQTNQTVYFMHEVNGQKSD